MLTNTLNNEYFNEINNDLIVNGNIECVDITIKGRLNYSGLNLDDIKANSVTTKILKADKAQMQAINNLIVGDHDEKDSLQIIHTGKKLEDNNNPTIISILQSQLYNPKILYPISFIPESVGGLQKLFTQHIEQSLLSQSLIISSQIGLDISWLSNLQNSNPLFNLLPDFLLSKLTDGSININVNAYLNDTSTNTLQVRNLSNAITTSGISKIIARDSNNNIIPNVNYLIPNGWVKVDSNGYLITTFDLPKGDKGDKGDKGEK